MWSWPSGPSWARSTPSTRTPPCSTRPARPSSRSTSNHSTSGGRIPVDHALVGEAGSSWTGWPTRCSGQPGPPAPRGGEPGGGGRTRTASWTSPSSPRTRMPVAPQRTIALQETFPDDGIITCDAGENRLFMMHWYRTKSSSSYLQPAAGGGMGYSVPAALGAKLACPDRPVLAVCGDGGFAMSIHALMTAVQARISHHRGRLQQQRAGLGPPRDGRAGRRRRVRRVRPRRHRPVGRLRRHPGDEHRRAAHSSSASVADRTIPFVIDVPTSLQDVLQGHRPVAGRRPLERRRVARGTPMAPPSAARRDQVSRRATGRVPDEGPIEGGDRITAQEPEGPVHVDGQHGQDLFDPGLAAAASP